MGDGTPAQLLLALQQGTQVVGSSWCLAGIWLVLPKRFCLAGLPLSLSFFNQQEQTLEEWGEGFLFFLFWLCLLEALA